MKMVSNKTFLILWCCENIHSLICGQGSAKFFPSEINIEGSAKFFPSAPSGSNGIALKVLDPIIGNYPKTLRTLFLTLPYISFCILPWPFRDKHRDPRITVWWEWMCSWLNMCWNWRYSVHMWMRRKSYRTILWKRWVSNAIVMFSYIKNIFRISDKITTTI